MSRDAKSAVLVNQHTLRESWLQKAIEAVRPYFEQAGYPIPQKIRVAVGFSSSGRKGTVGETWHAPASADGSFEIFIRPDISDPLEVMSVLVKQLVHAALPAKQDHGDNYRTAAAAIGFKGKRHRAVPTLLLSERLNSYLADLGPFPHAKLDINWKAIDRPKKQTTRMLKAECPGGIGDDGHHQPCGYTVRVAAKWAELGPPSCPKHGAMQIDVPDVTNEEEQEGAELSGASHPENLESVSHA